MYPNKIRISNGEGQVSITAISRAFEVGQVAEDFDLSKYTSVEHDSDKNFLVLLFHPSIRLWWTLGLCLDYPM